MLNVSEIRTQSKEALLAQVKEISKEIYNLSNELRINKKLDKPHLLKLKKKDRARVMLALHEKQLETKGQ